MSLPDRTFSTDTFFVETGVPSCEDGAGTTPRIVTPTGKGVYLKIKDCTVTQGLLA